jgi:hypothetical protein
MARARNLKPSFFTNDILAEIDPLGRILFQGLWCLADRAGRLEDRPKKIKAEVLPYDDCDADAYLSELHEKGFILRYAANGKRFIQVLAFTKHQNPHIKEAASTIPAPCENSTSTVQEHEQEVSDDGQASEIPERAGLIPLSLNPITDSPLPITDSPSSDSDSPSVRRLRVAKNPATAPETGELWNSYSTAYQGRYGAPPVRNAKVNAQLANLIKRLGSDEAPGVAAWYVSSNNRYYVQKRHAVDCLLADAEGLRTEWATRRRVTETGAREADRLQANGDMWGRLIEEAREQEKSNVPS